MKRLGLFIAAAFILCAPAAQAANSTVSAMTAASALGGTELLYVVQGAADRKGTPAQFATYIYGLASGDCTISGTGAVVCLKTNGVAFTALATTAPGTGVATALGVNVGSAGAFVTFNGALGTPSSGTLTNATGLPIAGTTGWGTGVAAALANPINATSGFATYVLGSSSAFGLVKVDGSTITASGGVISAVSGSGTVTSVATSCGATGGTITTSGTIKAAVTASSQTGANYAFQDSDCGKLINLSNASAQAPTLAAAGSGGLLFSAGGFVQVCNQGAGVQTLTPTTSTIGGAATYPLGAGSAKSPTCIAIVSDGTNYQVVPDALVGTVTGALKASTGGVISQAACADLSNAGALCSTTPGTGVATAAAANLSAAGGLTSTIASGTSALGTGAISSATCATVVTTTATNTATTDAILWGFNGDPTAVTGYVPLVAGMLTIIAYPSSGNVNFKVCNNTSGSVTPGAITLNWRVVR